MRRTCSTCEQEYRHDGATARVDGRLYIACCGSCLVAQLREIARAV